ncbi:cold shock domain-containing protein [Acinetobacter sp. c3-l95]|uniref:cold shock domain-containing protein n=1 Tax=Acinetobacter sp. c3-l95 TaxID=3342804 RepID=UPI0035BA977E
MHTGKIVRWQDDRGFGFVQSENFDKDIFIHATAFPKGSNQPKIGDEIIFTVQNTVKGMQVEQARYKKQPANPISQNRSAKNARNTKKSNNNSGIFGSVFTILALAAIAYYGYQHFFAKSTTTQNQQTLVNQPTANSSQSTAPTSSQSEFKCDGREYCSQMSSREEAEWFNKNCPNTKMDGDGDGDVCENDSRW